jgi:hypothetical protein
LTLNIIDETIREEPKIYKANKFSNFQKSRNQMMSRSTSNLGAGIKNKLPVNKKFSTSIYASNKIFHKQEKS